MKCTRCNSEDAIAAGVLYSQEPNTSGMSMASVNLGVQCWSEFEKFMGFSSLPEGQDV